MFKSVRSRILAGFGAIMLMSATSAAVNVKLLAAIETDFSVFQSALDAKSRAVDMDLVMTKVRVRVNQWLRSMNPAFAKQADDLLAQDKDLLANAQASATNPKQTNIIGGIDHALTAYIESWRVIQSLYADEDRLYAGRIIQPGAAIEAELAALRDADTQDPAASRLLAKARDGFTTAEIAALRYRSSLKPADAEQLAASVAAALGALDQAAAATQDGADRIKLAANTLTTWQQAFNDAAKLGQTRIARLASWTSKEGEAMAVGAAQLRTEEEASAAAAQNSVVDTISNSRFSLYLASGLILLAGAGVSLLLALSITRPFGRITLVLRRLAAGDRNFDIPDAERRDEIGEMAQAARMFKDNAVEVERLRAVQEASVAEAAGRQQLMLNQMADRFEGKVGGLVQQLSSAAGTLQDTAQSMSGTATQADHQVATVSASAEQASAGVQAVAAAAEELSASINEISRQVAQSTLISSKAVNDARRTDTIVAELAAAAQKIGQVVGLIKNVAGQTNLLALNATIEAARAGDAGKGFAVVASEVKNLALQTTKATQEISGQIEHIQSATALAVEAIGGITVTIVEVNTIAATIAAAVEEQGAATAEIARNVQATADSTRDVTTYISDVGNAAKATGGAASLVLGAARDLSKQAANLTEEVSSFVGSVRAA